MHPTDQHEPRQPPAAGTKAHPATVREDRISTRNDKCPFNTPRTGSPTKQRPASSGPLFWVERNVASRDGDKASSGEPGKPSATALIVLSAKRHPPAHLWACMPAASPRAPSRCRRRCHAGTKTGMPAPRPGTRRHRALPAVACAGHTGLRWVGQRPDQPSPKARPAGQIESPCCVSISQSHSLSVQAIRTVRPARQGAFLASSALSAVSPG